MAIATFTVTKSRIYADEPLILVVTGLGDREGLSDYFKFIRFRYVDALSPGSAPIGWDSISDSPNYTYDPTELDPTLPLTWSMDQVMAAYDANEIWKQLSWNPATGTAVIYRGPHGTGYPKYRYELDSRAQGTTDNKEIEVIRSNMPDYLRSQYTAVWYQGDVKTSLSISNVHATGANVKVDVLNYKDKAGDIVIAFEVRQGGTTGPSIYNDFKTVAIAANSTASNTWNISTLESSKSYSVIAFAMKPDLTAAISGNATGSFTTLSASAPPPAPVVWYFGDIDKPVLNASNIGQTSATITVTASNFKLKSGDVALSFEAREGSATGITIYSDSVSKTVGSLGTITHTWNLSSLEPAKTYYVAAFVQDSAGKILSTVGSKTFNTVSAPSSTGGLPMGVILAAGAGYFLLSSSAGKKLLRKVRL